MDFETTLHQANKGFCIYRLDDQTKNQTITSGRKMCNVVLIDSNKSFLSFLGNITNDKFDFRGHFFFVLLQGLKGFKLEMIEKLWDMNIANANLISRSLNKKTIDILSFSPFNNHKCGDGFPQVYEAIKSGNYRGNWEEILHDNTINLFGCPLRLVTFDRCPATCVEINGKKLFEVHGYDIGIINIIAEKLNFQLNKTILPGPEQWGELSSNGSATGAIKKLIDKEADLAIGNYPLRLSQMKDLDSSSAYFSLPLVFAIPFGEKYSPFEKLLQPFEYIVWILILVTLSFGICVIFVINWKLRRIRNFVYGTDVENPIINMLIAIFGLSQTKLPKGNFARFLLMIFLLFCLVQRNLYQGALYIFLQSDGRHKEVQSLEEMVSKNFEYHMFDSYSEFTESMPEIHEK